MQGCLAAEPWAHVCFYTDPMEMVKINSDGVSVLGRGFWLCEITKKLITALLQTRLRDPWVISSNVGCGRLQPGLAPSHQVDP